MNVTQAKDFAAASFRVAISRIQQVALDKASAKIPCPEDQLKLLHERRCKAKEREMNLSWYDIFYSFSCIDPPELEILS